MEKKAFQQGIALLSEAFPKLELSTALYWEMLRDLESEAFLRSVVEIIKTIQELFPTSNLIAIIRAKTQEQSLKLRDNRENKQLEHHEQGDSRTPEWKLMIEKLAKEKKM